MDINPVELSALSGLAASAATATALSVGSWPAAIGTGIVSVITTSGSSIGAYWAAETLTTLVGLSVSENAALGIYVISALATLVALNSLALSAVIWTGLPIATLSLTAKVTASVITAIPLTLLIAADICFPEDSNIYNV